MAPIVADAGGLSGLAWRGGRREEAFSATPRDRFCGAGVETSAGSGLVAMPGDSAGLSIEMTLTSRFGLPTDAGRMAAGTGAGEAATGTESRAWAAGVSSPA